MNFCVRDAAMMLVLAFLLPTFAGPLDRAWLKGVTDRDPLSYRVGDEVSFTVTAEGLEGTVPDGAYFLSWKRTGDDGVVTEGREAFDGKTPFVCRTKIGTPGFVRLEAYVVDKEGNRYRQAYLGDTRTPEGQKAMNRFEKKPHFVFFDGGAGAETERLELPPEPADFDAFWKGQFARLDAVPLRVDRVELENKYDDYRLFAVRLDSAGLRPVTGYLIEPPDAGTRKYPAVLQLFGYDRNVSQHNPPPGAYKKDAIVLEINAYGMNLPAFGGTEADRKALKWEIESNGFTYAFDPKQNADPETAFFNGMVLRIKRALQYLKTLPEWDGRNLMARGGSQGGLQTVWAAACGEGVTAAESYVTWCCDIAGNDRRDGWYVKWTEALGYYDAVNWAKRIPGNCRVDVVRAGLGDYVCPPMGLAKLWKALTCSKRIMWVQGSQHGYVPPEAYPGRDVVWTSGWTGD